MPHRTVLTTAEWRGGVAKPNGGRHGSIYDEGQKHAGKVLGRGGDHGGVHPQPRSHQGPEGQDAVRGLAWTQAERFLAPDIRLHRPRKEDEAGPDQARGQEHTDGVSMLCGGYQGVPAL